MKLESTQSNDGHDRTGGSARVQDEADGPRPGAGRDVLARSGGLHRLTWLILALVWPLIWVGGLVTTYDAGMSVPDWPGTYGYNLLLYPYSTWLSGPFDLFIEHGHRLLGAVVGVVAIAIVVVAFRTESRRWVVWLSVAVLAMVIAQGGLGGMRVVLSDRTLAMVHGCFGPAFFAVCAFLGVATGHWWTSPPPDGGSADRATVGWGRIGLAGMLIVLAYGQLVLGAMLRHVQPTASVSYFAGIIGLHITGAIALWTLTAVTVISLRRCGDLTLSRPAGWLVGLVGVQIALGCGTWVVNYGWPRSLAWMPGGSDYLLQAKGFLDSMIVTAHVATGSLILAVSTVLLVRLIRRRWQHRRVHATEPVSAPLAEKTHRPTLVGAS